MTRPSSLRPNLAHTRNPMNTSALSLRRAATVAAASVAWSATADVLTEPSRTFTVGLDLPAYTDPAASFLGRITDSAITSLVRVSVGLHLVGTAAEPGFASDMIVTLTKTDLDAAFSPGDPTAVLLNRVGVTDENPVGFFYDGWNMSFDDYGEDGDIHLVDSADPTSALLGTYEPDGRGQATDSDRPFMLSQFQGGTGNGDWWLNLADLMPGGAMRLESFSITLTGLVPGYVMEFPQFETSSAVPEPGTWAAAGALALLGLRYVRHLSRPE
jgi:hypothetical protein